MCDVYTILYIMYIIFLVFFSNTPPPIEKTSLMNDLLDKAPFKTNYLKSKNCVIFFVFHNHFDDLQMKHEY